MGGMRKRYMIYSLCCLLYCIPAIGQKSILNSQFTEYFFPGGKAIGQPFTSKQTHIRMVRVCSFEEAYCFFRRLCVASGNVEKYSHSGYFYYRTSLPEGKGYFLFTDKVVPKRNEVAILRIKVPYLVERGINEIHFVETIKIKRKK